MNKRLKKKLNKENQLPEVTVITKNDVQRAWNIIADYMNKRQELTFHISPWNKAQDRKYTLHSTENGDLLIANTEWEG